MNLTPKWLAIGAGILILLVGAVLAFVLLGGSDEPDPEPTQSTGGPAVVITPPVTDPTQTAEGEQVPGDIAHDDDELAPEGLDSVWTYDESAEEYDAHDVGEEASGAGWVPAAQGFVTAFQNTGADDATWLAGIAPYVDTRLHDAYAVPGVRENVYVSQFRDFEVVMGGETATRVRATFADSGANMILDLGLGDTESGWIVTRVSADAQ